MTEAKLGVSFESYSNVHSLCFSEVLFTLGAKAYDQLRLIIYMVDDGKKIKLTIKWVTCRPSALTITSHVTYPKQIHHRGSFPFAEQILFQ